ncbi:MAG: cytochrome c biogenesis protein CcdA [Mariprofundus sp.]|nr:cytochrome c biogenesis protein CcdA [Mariprofundus sp.]
MGAGTALWGGFHSFFSIWQVCLVQISPFYMAFIVGLFLATAGQKDNPTIGRWVGLPFLAYTVGFTVIYSILISSGLNISKSLLYNISSLRVAAGVAILIAAMYILLIDRICALRCKLSPMLLSALSLLIGLSFALIYAPCITPTMSDIMSIASKPQTAVQGWHLAVFYGIGICAAFGVTGMALILLLRRSNFVMQHTRLMKNICGVILLIPALLALTGTMRHFKAFFLGFMV